MVHLIYFKNNTIIKTRHKSISKYHKLLYILKRISVGLKISLEWNKLRSTVFPQSDNIQQFKSTINRFLLRTTTDGAGFPAQYTRAQLFL